MAQLSLLTKTLLVTGTLSGFGSWVQAAGPDGCHGLADNDARLACYDRETGYIASGPTSATPDDGNPSGQQWRLTSEGSALEERTDIWLSLRSNNTEPNAIGTATYATLWVRCMENKTNLLIGFNRYTSDNQSVRYKLDDQPISKHWMETMRGGEGIGIWTGGKAIPFIRRMFGRDDMVIAYETYSGPVEFVFDISGLRQRIDPLANACSWSP